MSEDSHKVGEVKTADAPKTRVAWIINDGPDYAPNFQRTVAVMRAGDMPSTVLCWDIDRKEVVIVDSSYLRRAERVDVPL